MYGVCVCDAAVNKGVRDNENQPTHRQQLRGGSQHPTPAQHPEPAGVLDEPRRDDTHTPRAAAATHPGDAEQLVGLG